MKLRSSLALSLALVLPLAHAQTPAAPDAAAGKSALPLQPTATEAEAAQLSARFLTRFHYEAKPLDDVMSSHVYDAYLKMLDGEKVFFTRPEIDRFNAMRTKLDDAIWNKDLSGPFSIFNLYVRHAVERMTYARELLKKGFDFSRDETYTYDRKNAAWPADQAALDDLWRRRTKNDWLRLKLAGKDDAEIRKTLGKRYAGYIDRVKQLDGEDAFKTFMAAYAETTDPHTDYLSPRDAANFDISMKLSLEGIGAVLQARDEYTQVREVVPGGPAAKSGKIEVGDRIVAIGQGEHGPMTDVVGWRLDDVVDKIRGKKGTTVRLEILPAEAGVDGKHELVSMVRKKVSIEEQAAKKKEITITDNGVTRKIGVIDLPTFYSDFGARSKGDKNYKSATRDVARLLGQMKADGVQGVIMDLRNNGGGSLAEANELTGLFIDQGPVVQVRDTRGQVDVQGDDQPGLAWAGPMAVLVNRGSASASEIFTAAIQDYGRGLVIGEPTFGKGTVQNLVDLDRFSPDPEHAKYGELKMTIAQFFRINGGSTQLKGVTPDIEYPKNGDEKDFGESTYDNALPWSHIDPAQYQPVAMLKAYLPQLTARHMARVTRSPAWQLMLDELNQYKKMHDQTTVSLNLAKREAERKQQDALQASFRQRQKALDGDAAVLDTASVDDGLTASERSLKAELKREEAAKNAPDPELKETAHILYDAVGLIRSNPKLAAEVLPYGGRFSSTTAAATADQQSPGSVVR